MRRVKNKMNLRILKPAGLFFESLFDRAVSVAGALIFIQIPAFLVQYQQRLGGHVDELASLIKRYKSAAADNGRTVEEYIGLHLQSDVKEFVSTGKIMTENMDRFTSLSAALKDLSASKGLIKFFHFIKDIDFDIFKSALKNFVPGISFQSDTILYGIMGIIIFMSIYFVLKKSLLFIISRIKNH
jgi:hypothetical protein